MDKTDDICFQANPGEVHIFLMLLNFDDLTREISLGKWTPAGHIFYKIFLTIRERGVMPTMTLYVGNLAPSFSCL